MICGILVLLVFVVGIMFLIILVSYTSTRVLRWHIVINRTLIGSHIPGLLKILILVFSAEELLCQRHILNVNKTDS